MSEQLLSAIFNTIESTQKNEILPNSSLYLVTFANQDYKQARNFLLAYKNNPETFKTYRREIERFLQWSWLIRKQSIFNHKRDDITSYVDFCQKPPKNWIGLNQLPRFINKEGTSAPNPKWRPFVAEINKAKVKEGKHATKDDFSLSQAALKIIFATLSSFYNFLIQEEQLAANPVALIKQKNALIRKKQNTTPIRRLSQEQWRYVIKAAEILACKNQTRDHRTLFIVQALYGMYLRISELVASSRWMPQMNSFYKDNDGNWWFKVVGKGNKERDISVSDEMLEALKNYRNALNLTPLPSPIDDSPLLPKFSGQGAITDTRYIRTIVQKTFDLAYQLMVADKKQDDAAELKMATVHWLRHTGISDDVKIRPREHVRDDAGHSSGAITDKYIDIEKRARHQSAKKKPLIN